MAKPRRFLLIDDDYTDQKLVEIILGRHQITVDECMTPTAAPMLIEKNGYDAILVDYRLPLLNGIELVKKLQGQFHCPVFMVSSHDPEKIRTEAFAAGVEFAGIISKDGLRKNLEAIVEVIYGATT